MNFSNRDQKDWDRELEAMIEAEKEQYAEEARKNTLILKGIKEEFGEKYYNAVFNCIMESEGCGLYELVKKPKGNFQEEDWGPFSYLYVDQWQDGGITGDSFAGDIYIPMKDGQYLKVKYQM